jgi:hypothetical protein
MHHPLMSNGSHGGQFSIEKQIFPLEQKNSLTSYWLIYKPTKKKRQPVLKISKTNNTLLM